MTDTPAALQHIAAAIFCIALIHTLSVSRFERLAQRFPRHAGLLHLLGEVEIVFGFWAIVLVVVMSFVAGGTAALDYAESQQYTEPLFVFVVMVIAGTKPILHAVEAAIASVAAKCGPRRELATAWLGLAVVPLLGSAITEPAAMTIAALLLAPLVFRQAVPARARYLALGVLLVNVSIGGTLSSFAAPPVLMVADAWGWTSAYMMKTFGWKAAIAVVVNATIAAWFLRRELDGPAAPPSRVRSAVPVAIVAVHLAFLAAVVVLAHHPVAFLAIFLMFLGFTQAYARHQDPLIVKEALLVAFFLAGLVVLGGLQRWWLQPLVAGMSAGQLFVGAAALTAIADNAALTYLGSLVPSMTAEARYSLVAGAVAGGGLTVIANAPNPAGVALLRAGFEDGTIGAGGLFAGALVPTSIALAAFWLL